MLFKNGQLREEYRSLSPNSLRILAWQEDQYERPSRIAKYEQKQKRKMADRAESSSRGSNASRRPGSRSPRKRTRSSHGELYGGDGDAGSEEGIDVEALDPTLTQEAFSAAISFSSQQPMADLRTAAHIQQISPSLSRSSRISPTRQSTAYSHSRTPSPSKGGLRQKRIALKYTNPKFYSGLPELHNPEEDTVDEFAEIMGITRPVTLPGHFEIPPHIAALVSSLSETAVTPGCIPYSLSSSINKASCGTEPIPQGAYTSEPQSPYAHISGPQLLSLVKNIHKIAHKASDEHQDEHSWYPLVRSVISGPVPYSFLEVDEVQSRFVAQELLPVAGAAKAPIATVKIDQVIQFDTAHWNIKAVLDPLFEHEPGLSLSAFNDPVAAKTFTAAIVEVKSPGGDYDEGVYQLSIASAAVLARLRLLEHDLPSQLPDSRDQIDLGPQEKDGMPVIGWLVHGHFWYMHITYRQVDGSIRTLGPLPSGNTATYLGIFRLLRIIHTAKRWIVTSYWPYLKSIAKRRRALSGGRGDD